MTNRRKTSLQTKIMFFSIVIVALSVLSVSFGFLQTMEENMQQEIENHVLNTARIVARIPTVIEAFDTAHPEQVIDPLMKTIRQSSKDVEFIVVTDLEGIRYSHPNPDRLLERFVGGDEGPALQEGREYVSVAQGTLGVSTRALTPIFNAEGERLGMVSVGILNQNIDIAIVQLRNRVYLYVLAGLILGMMGSILMARHLKSILLGLEPYQISKLLKERNGILKAIKEGVMAIDEQGNVSMINDTARQMLQIAEDKAEGMPILEVLPDSKMMRVLKSGEPEFDYQDVMNGVPIMVNRIPITDEKGQMVGVISSFRQRDELTNLAEELTGARMLVDSLRANTHEFMSKMHVILGLLHLEKYREAEGYILEETANQQILTSHVIQQIKEPSVAALVIGKISAAREAGVKLHIDGTSQLSKLQGRVSGNALITVIGNLLANAIEAMQEKEEGRVSLTITENQQAIMVQVEDQGEGLPVEEEDKIFKRGFSTRDQGRGIGLFLVKQVVNSLNGNIRYESEPGQGTTFWVRLPKGESKEMASYEEEPL